MIDPVDVQQIALAAICSGAVVFFGTAYAVFYALSRLNADGRLLLGAYAFYGGLVVAAIGVLLALHLTGWWLTLVAAMLVGYLIAPRCIWRLSVDVHELADGIDASN